MQKAAARILDCSADGVIAEEGTKFFQYCRDLPDDPAQMARTRSFTSAQTFTSWAGTATTGQQSISRLPSTTPMATS